MKRLLLSVFVAFAVTTCGDGGQAPPDNSDNVDPNGAPNNATNNATNSSTNNASNNATNNNASNNGTANNGSTNTNTNNGTTNNVTTNNDPGCADLDPAIGSCDPICQSGCEVGEHCITTGDPLVAECGPAGPGAQGQACNADTECGVGLHCRSFGGMNRRCTTYCAPDRSPTGCPLNHGCVRFVSEPRLGACFAIENECDAVPDDSCEDPDECYDTVTGRKCRPSGDLALDEPCGQSSDCQPGLRCVAVGDTGKLCRTLCDPDGGAEQCPDDETCNALQNSAGEDLTWGACF